MWHKNSEIPVQEHRTGISLLMLLTIAIISAACSVAGKVPIEAPDYMGTFEASCSPVDGHAIQFELYRLGDGFPAQASISIWQFEIPMAGSHVRLREQGGYGAAYISGTEWIPAIDGEIGFEDYVEGDIASGWFWLELDGIDRIEGNFEVAWSDASPAICG